MHKFSEITWFTFPSCWPNICIKSTLRVVENMTALIVGGDNIESIKNELHAQGICKITHWNGRKHGDKNYVIPGNTELIVVLVNFVNHSLSCKVKKEAKRLNLPVIYSRNSRHSFTVMNTAY